jgi:hypothetical protein
MIRLTVELVPETCWYSNVRSNVSKEDWDKLRKAVYVKAGYVCEICGGKGTKWPVECHEVWHYDDAEHIQTLERMIALCPSCHEVKHIGFANVRGRYSRALNHLSYVNGWTPEQAEEYIATQFILWKERSKHTWQLNIECLGDYTGMKDEKKNEDDK